MNERNGAETWHYGIVARYWAEFNNDGPEIPFFRAQIERFGQPALDVPCGTGRLLLPYLRAGLDVDGCDVSGDMLALCRDKAEAEGLAPPRLYEQAMHDLDLPRRYRTLIVCGGFGLGADRARDLQSLRRFHAHLEPGGALLLDHHLPYGSLAQWAMWPLGRRRELPEPWPEGPVGRRRAADGSEYELHARTLALDPFEQTATLEMRAALWRDGKRLGQETMVLREGLYFKNELGMLLEQAGFTVAAIRGGYSERAATAEDDVLVFECRK